MQVVGELQIALCCRLNQTFAPAKDKGQGRQDFQCPAVYGCVIDKDAVLLHHLFDVAPTQWTNCVPASTQLHDFQRTVRPLEYLA